MTLVIYQNQNTDDQYFYDITLNENKNIEAAPPHGLPIKGPSSGAQTASGNNIPQNVTESNNNFQLSVRDDESAADDTAAERKGRTKSYAMLQAQNKILQDI